MGRDNSNSVRSRIKEYGGIAFTALHCHHLPTGPCILFPCLHPHFKSLGSCPLEPCLLPCWCLPSTTSKLQSYHWPACRLHLLRTLSLAHRDCLQSFGERLHCVHLPSPIPCPLAALGN